MLSQQGLCCGSLGADRSTSCGRPQVCLRGWKEEEKEEQEEEEEKEKKIGRLMRSDLVLEPAQLVVSFFVVVFGSL